MGSYAKTITLGAATSTDRSTGESWLCRLSEAQYGVVEVTIETKAIYDVTHQRTGRRDPRPRRAERAPSGSVASAVRGAVSWAHRDTISQEPPTLRSRERGNALRPRDKEIRSSAGERWTSGSWR